MRTVSQGSRNAYLLTRKIPLRDLSRVLLLHWNVPEAADKVQRLRAAGFETSKVPLEIPVAFKQLRENPPSAVVIDLSRLPSAGRDVAMSLRTYKATRHVPIVFVDGDPKKVAQIKEFLPDACYTSWDDIRNSLRRAITHPPSEPVVPKSRLEGYSGASLPKKLGIRKGSVVSLIDAPSGFERALGKLPDDVVVHTRLLLGASVTIWFLRSRKDLEARIKQMIPLASKGGLWIAWPKKGSGQQADLSQVVVRRAGLAAGIVDFKISSLDSTWSGLRFSSRRVRG